LKTAGKLKNTLKFPALTNLALPTATK